MVYTTILSYTIIYFASRCRPQRVPTSVSSAAAIPRMLHTTHIFYVHKQLCVLFVFSVFFDQFVIYLSLSLYIYIYIYIYMHTCVYIYIYICIHLYHMHTSYITCIPCPYLCHYHFRNAHLSYTHSPTPRLLSFVDLLLIRAATYFLIAPT